MKERDGQGNRPENPKFKILPIPKDKDLFKAGDKRSSVGDMQPKKQGEEAKLKCTFDCAIPEIIVPPAHYRLMLRSGDITEEHAKELEQSWVDKELKVMGTKELKEKVILCQKDYFISINLTKRQEEAQDIRYELELMRKELRQRK